MKYPTEKIYNVDMKIFYAKRCIGEGDNKDDDDDGDDAYAIKFN